MLNLASTKIQNPNVYFLKYFCRTSFSSEFVDILPDPGSLIVAEPLDLDPGPEHCLQLINISIVPAGFELF